MAYSKTTYTGPVKNRGVDDEGRALVSREELADFRRKYGADKTLRDLLNADRTGRTPSSASDMRARGPQEANVAPRASVGDIPGLIARGMAEGADRVPFGRGLGAAFTAAGAARGAGLGAMAAYRGAKGVVDTVRDAVQASRGLEEARRARLAREMDRELPPLAPKERVRVEGTKGGVYRSTKDEKAAEPKAEFRSRTADRMDEREMEFRHGGKVKAYKSGGSVKGSGCEQRGLRKCKVY